MSRHIWIDKPIGPVDIPQNVKAKLLGVYNTEDKYATIYLIIELHGTEYKLTRYHRKTTKGPDQAALQERFRKTVGHFCRRFEYAPFSMLVEQFLDWSDNPMHEVLRKYVKSQPQDT